MRRYFVGLLLFGFAHLAMGYSFTLNQIEWNSWPEYCKAKYVVTNVGEVSPFARQVSPDTIAKWKGRLGETWWNIHHGCAGMIWIVRAEKLEGKNAQQYQFAIKRAHDEAEYSLQRTPQTDPLYGKFIAVQARVAYAVGQGEQAIKLLRASIKNAPEVADSYAVLATFLYKQGKFAEARAVLEDGIAKVKPPTAEMHYFLGLILVKQKDYAPAEVQAKAAYALGYPLPGLKNKLKAAGHWSQ